MQPGAVKTRFAPSPTGYLHLGNARTALFNALLARRWGGLFVLRVEDTDAERSRRDYERAIAEDLRWLGLEWQEGPEAGGPVGPYRQSERGEIYARHYEALAAQGASYPCFCTQAELERARAAQRAAGQPPRYPGTCARLSPEEVQARLDQGARPAIRFRVPKGEPVVFDDRVRGTQRFATDEIGDFVIRRADGSPAFFFGNAVDDALMGVTHVLRGEDHLANTPRQILLLEALGLTPPAYGHLPLIVGADGGPLSKRAGAPTLGSLREGGYLPEAVVNHLARLGHPFPGEALQTLDELAAAFDPAQIGRAPARHDPAQLRHWQKRAVEEADDLRLWGWACAGAPAVTERVPAEAAARFMGAVRDNVEMPGDVARWSWRVFADPLDYDQEALAALREAGPGFFDVALEQLAGAGEDFAAYAKAVGAAAGVKGKALFMPLRAALTGRTRGPEMARLWRLWNTERVRGRLERARDQAGR